MSNSSLVRRAGLQTMSLVMAILPMSCSSPAYSSSSSSSGPFHPLTDLHCVLRHAIAVPVRVGLVRFQGGGERGHGVDVRFLHFLEELVALPDDEQRQSKEQQRPESRVLVGEDEESAQGCGEQATQKVPGVVAAPNLIPGPPFIQDENRAGERHVDARENHVCHERGNEEQRRGETIDAAPGQAMKNDAGHSNGESHHRDVEDDLQRRATLDQAIAHQQTRAFHKHRGSRTEGCDHRNVHGGGGQPVSAC